ncbi:MAG TPA: hypothetical protein VGL22_20890 [Terracidiphilus sp.]
MKVILIICAVIVAAALVFADYKWRKWVAARRAGRDGSANSRV